MTTVPAHTPPPGPLDPGRAHGGTLSAYTGLTCRWCTTPLSPPYRGARHGAVCPVCDAPPTTAGLNALPDVPTDLLPAYLAGKVPHPRDLVCPDRERIIDEAA